MRTEALGGLKDQKRRGGGRAAGTGREDAAHGLSPEAAQAMLGCGLPGRLAEEAWPSYNGKRQGDRAAELAGASGLKPMEDGDRCDSIMHEVATTGRHTQGSPRRRHTPEHVGGAEPACCPWRHRAPELCPQDGKGGLEK